MIRSENILGLSSHGRNLHVVLSVPSYGISLNSCTCFLQPINGSISFHGDCVHPLEVRHLRVKDTAIIPETIEGNDICGLDAENGMAMEDAASRLSNTACDVLTKALPSDECIDYAWLCGTVQKLLVQDPSRLLLTVIFIDFPHLTGNLSDLVAALPAVRPKYPRETRIWTSQAPLTTLLQCDNDDIAVWLLSLMINRGLSMMRKHGGCIRPVVVIDLLLEGNLRSMPGCISSKIIEKTLHFGEYYTLNTMCTYYTGSSSLGRAPLSILSILTGILSDLKEKDLLLSPLIFLTRVTIDSITGRILSEFLKSFPKCKVLTVTHEKLPKLHLPVDFPECRCSMEDIFPFGMESYLQEVERSVSNTSHEESNLGFEKNGCVLDIEHHRVTVIHVLNGIEARLSHYGVEKFHGLNMGVLDENFYPPNRFVMKGLAKISAIHNRTGYVRIHSTLRKQDLDETVRSLGRLAFVYNESSHTQAEPSIL